MPYATQADAEALYGVAYVATCADPDNTGSADADILAAAFLRATSEINGHLAGRVPLPLSPVPDNIQAWCVDLALYYASAVACDVMTTLKQTLYDQAIKGLTAVAKNAQALGLEAPAPNKAASANVDAETRVFDRTSMGKVL